MTNTLIEFVVVSIGIFKLVFLPSVIVHILFKIPGIEKIFCRVFGFKIEE